MTYEIKYCPNCNKELEPLKSYEDEYYCKGCDTFWEILLINETGKKKLNY